MRVKVTKRAFHNGARVKPGDVINVAEGAKGKWFEPVEDSDPKAGKTRGKKPKDDAPPEGDGSEFL